MDVGQHSPYIHVRHPYHQLYTGSFFLFTLGASSERALRRLECLADGGARGAGF